MTEQFIIGAQKSTNQLKALLAKLLPAAGDDGVGAECSDSAVDALLSDINDSLSEALASLRLGASHRQRQPAPSGQSSMNAGGGGGSDGRRSAPRRSGQRVRMDGMCRMIVLQNGVHDSYTWRKYGQKEILGSRFPRSYFKCGQKSGCPAKKQVQQSDADPSKLEITYIDEHTCDGQPSSSLRLVPDPAIGSNVLRSTGVLPVGSVPAALRTTKYQIPEEMTCTASMEQEQAALLFIPSPACSQSELLPAEVPKIAPHNPPVWMDHGLACHDEGVISDFAVPDL